MTAIDRAPKGDANYFPKALELLGGTKVLGRDAKDPLAMHKLIVHGLPAAVVENVRRKVALTWTDAEVELAFGMSVRTAQRRKGSSSAEARPLSAEQGGRVWVFAEILAKATDVFGTQEAAEQWLQKPALALDDQRPLDLLASPAGVSLVEELLGRLEYGVYT